MEIGFIGVGKMGFPMARRLIEAGHQLTVYDTRREPVEQLVKLGAKAASSVREVADGVETILASLPTPDIVHSRRGRQRRLDRRQPHPPLCRSLHHRLGDGAEIFDTLSERTSCRSTARSPAALRGRRKARWR